MRDSWFQIRQIKHVKKYQPGTSFEILMLLLKQERALLQGTDATPCEQPWVHICNQVLLRQHRVTSKLGHTPCGRGGEQADVCEEKLTQIRAREHRHRCAGGCPEIPWLIFSWKELSLRSGFIFMLDLRIPTGDSVFFPFRFLVSFNPLPSTTAVSVSKSAGPLTLHIRAR